MRFIFVGVVSAAAFLLASCVTTETVGDGDMKDKKGDKISENLEKTDKILAKIKPSQVVVRYYLKYDKGKPPQMAGYRCSLCSMYHGRNAETYIKEERPLEVPGFLIKGNRVITPDLLLHSRFIKRITVAAQGEEVGASISNYAANQPAVFLKLESNLKDVVPLEFKPVDGPYLNYIYGLDAGLWQSGVKGFAGGITQINETGERLMEVAPNSLIVNKEGVPVTYTSVADITAENDWKNPPQKWELVSADEMKKLIDSTNKQVESSIFRIKLNFRSPKLKQKQLSGFGRRDGVIDTELNCIGILLSSKRLLVLADLSPENTARLENITLYPKVLEPVEARFVASLKDYGAFIAELKSEIKGGGVKFANNKIETLRNQLMIAADINLSGDIMSKYFINTYIQYYNIGWRGCRLPLLAGHLRDVFLFDKTGKLVAYPMKLRRKAKMDSEYSSSYSSRNRLVPVQYLSFLNNGFEKHVDPNNVPLSEADESRLAWMGVELQPMNPELAMANGVSELTDNGRNGALVTYVYPDSPAAKQGVVPGMIILRIIAKDDPEPIKIQVKDFARRPFPWEQFDRIPEMYYDRLPTPWLSAENSFNKLLTNLGFGKEFTAKFFDDGKTIDKKFIVTKSPEHYELAKKYSYDKIGLTVKDTTYEVNRYFQKKDGDPGVIISKLEPGSKASVAGLKPYEIITHVNDKPVKNVQEFENMVKDHKNLRFSVKRMALNRVVKIEL